MLPQGKGSRAAGRIRIVWIDGDYNQSGIFTKASITIDKSYRIGREII